MADTKLDLSADEGATVVDARDGSTSGIPTDPVPVPGDSDYAAPPANIVDTNDKPVVIVPGSSVEGENDGNTADYTAANNPFHFIQSNEQKNQKFDAMLIRKAVEAAEQKAREQTSNNQAVVKVNPPQDREPQ